MGGSQLIMVCPLVIAPPLLAAPLQSGFFPPPGLPVPPIPSLATGQPESPALVPMCAAILQAYLSQQNPRL